MSAMAKLAEASVDATSNTMRSGMSSLYELIGLRRDGNKNYQSLGFTLRDLLRN